MQKNKRLATTLQVLLRSMVCMIMFSALILLFLGQLLLPKQQKEADTIPQDELPAPIVVYIYEKDNQRLWKVSFDYINDPKIDVLDASKIVRNRRVDTISGFYEYGGAMALKKVACDEYGNADSILVLSQTGFSALVDKLSGVEYTSENALSWPDGGRLLDSGKQTIMGETAISLLKYGDLYLSVQAKEKLQKDLLLSAVMATQKRIQMGGDSFFYYLANTFENDFSYVTYVSWKNGMKIEVGG